jgi:hypothetical protein
MRTVTSYRLVNGEVVKTRASAMAREDYDAIIEKPFHQRVLDAYYKLECEQRPLGINKRRVAELHRNALAEGF